MKFLDLGSRFNGPASRWIEDADTLPFRRLPGSSGGRPAPRPPPATSRLRSKRLRFMLEPGRPHKTTVRLNGIAQMCTCISRPGMSDALPASYEVKIDDGKAWTCIRCPTDRPVRVNLPKERSFEMTVGLVEGTFDSHYVEVVILYS
jgi:hypothetical protein